MTDEVFELRQRRGRRWPNVLVWISVSEFVFRVPTLQSAPCGMSPMPTESPTNSQLPR